MKATIAAASSAALLSACIATAPIIFDKPGASQADFDQAWAQCDYETSAATQSTDYGYRTILGQELDRASRKRDLTLMCMRAKGFTPRPN